MRCPPCTLEFNKSQFCAHLHPSHPYTSILEINPARNIWDFSQPQIRLFSSSCHHPPAYNYSTPNNNNNKMKRSVSPPIESPPYQHWKANHIFPFLETIPGCWIDTLMSTTTPLWHIQSSQPNTSNKQHQIFVQTLCYHFPPLEKFNITLKFNPTPISWNSINSQCT